MAQWPLDSGSHFACFFQGTPLPFVCKTKKQQKKGVHLCPKFFVIISVSGESQWKISFQQNSRPPVRYAFPFQKPGKMEQWRPGATWGKHYNLTFIYDYYTKHRAHVAFEWWFLELQYPLFCCSLFIQICKASLYTQHMTRVGYYFYFLLFNIIYWHN